MGQQVGGLTVSNPLYQAPAQKTNTPATPTQYATQLPRMNPGGLPPDRNGTSVANFLGVANTNQQAQAPSKPPYYVFGGGKPLTPYVAPSTPPGGTTGTGGTSTPAPVDPYAAERARQAGIFSKSLPGAIGNINQNAADAFSGGNRELQARAESLYNTQRSGQRDINTSRENVELSRMNGIQDILDFVRQGLTNSSRAISARGASSSSAGEAFARGFSTKSEGMSRNVNNDAYMENNTLDSSQVTLDENTAQGRKDLERTRDSILDKIGSELRQQLYTLDMEGQKVGVTGKVQIEQLKQAAIDKGMGQLHQADQWLQGEMGKISKSDTNTVKKAAAGKFHDGMNSGPVLDYNTFAGQAQAPQGGPAMTQLPLFTRNKRV